MFDKQQASEMRHRFWIALGQYLAPIPSATGQKVNWINYKTGIKEIRLRMDAYKKEAFVAVEIRGTEEQRLKFYRMFESFKHEFPNDYTWIEHALDEHDHSLSRIYTELEGYSIFNQEHWPQLISFFKAQVILFDTFWSESKEIFEMAG